MSSPRNVCIALLLATSLMGSGSVARANAIYSYTGNPFTTFIASPGGNAGAFAGQSVSGEFTIASPLGDNFNGVVTPAEFSFFSGLIPITNFSATAYNFDIKTSDTGAIIDWTVSIQLGCSLGVQACLSILTSDSGDSTSSAGPTTFIEASNSGAPGSWSLAVTPIPAALPLFVTGLAALGLLRWSRKRKRIHSP